MNSFNTMAATWDDNPVRLGYAKAMADYMKKTCPEGRTALKGLEIGAGTGTLSVLLRECFEKAELIDSSSGMTEKTNEKLEAMGINNLHARNVNIMAFETIGQYDILYSAMFLHHVRDVKEVLEKLYDMTAYGGKLYLSDLYLEDGRFHPDTMEGIYHHGFDPDALANDLKDLGYSINNIETIFTMEKNGKEYPLFILECTK